MASPAPVLPLVGSTIVPPGASCPAASARSTMASPIRSFTDPPGLRYSTLARTAGASPRLTRARRTSGVPPMVSRIESCTCMGAVLLRRGPAVRARPTEGIVAPASAAVRPLPHQRLAVGADAGEQVGLVAGGGDQRADQGVVLPRVDLGHHLVGDGEPEAVGAELGGVGDRGVQAWRHPPGACHLAGDFRLGPLVRLPVLQPLDRKSTRLNSSHV